MTTTFQRTASATVDGSSEYLWSNVANWNTVLPTDGASVAFGVAGPFTVGGYDDIDDLFLDSLQVANTGLIVAGTLTIASLILSSTIEADTLLSGGTAAVTIDALGTAHGTIEAIGTNAIATVLAASDPGETYDAADGGMVVVSGSLNATSTLIFNFNDGTADTGALPATIALLHPGSTVVAGIGNAAVGDSIELPGSFVVAVNYGAHTVVTSAGTTALAIGFAGAAATGFLASPDATTGLEKITFTTLQTTDFEQTTGSIIAGGTQYLWSKSANWTDGVPLDGAAVAFGTPTGVSPGNDDDIANLFLDSLFLLQGTLAVTGALTVANLILNSGSNSAIAANTLLSGGTAAVTIDGLSGSGSRIEAIGSNAVTTVQALSDPGELYQAGHGGMVVLATTPAATSELILNFNDGTSDTGTIALMNPGKTVAAHLLNVGVGDAIELPGSAVTSVIYGSSTLSVVTNTGTTTFSDVSYLAGSVPTGFVAARDATTGLEEIAFTAQQSTSFQQKSASTVGSASEYLWSTATNWANGVPANGGAVTVDVSTATSPAGDDNIADLSLDSLNLEDGELAVTGTLVIGALTLNGLFSGGIETDTVLNGGTAALTINALIGTGPIEADGTNAVTTVQAASDPGEYYTTDHGGMLVLSPVPNAASDFFLNAGTSVSDVGTIAFMDPGGTIAAALDDVGVGDAIELPGSFVSSVSYGASSLTVITNAGTTVFSNVSTLSGHPAPNGFLATQDTTTGLEKITFTTQQSTTFQADSSSVVEGPDGGASEYLWSTTANWSNGVAANGATVVSNVALSYDNLTSLTLDSLDLQQGQLLVAGGLTIGSLTLGDGAHSAIAASTQFSTAAVAVTIDSLNGTAAGVAASGSNAVTTVLAAHDPGEAYSAINGGMLVLSAPPNAASTLDLGFENAGGTVALLDPGSTIAAALDIGPGDAIELPGSFIASVTYGATSLTIVSSAGTTSFSNVTYSAVPSSFVATPDASTGLEAVTFTNTTDFHQGLTSTVDGDAEYAWSVAPNWITSTPVDGDTVVFNVAATGAPDGYDDISSLSLYSLAMQQGELAVAGALTVESLLFDGGSNSEIETDTLSGASSATLTVDGLSGAGGTIAAFGTRAVTDVQASADPGEVYQAAQGGMVELTASPDASSQLLFDANSGTADAATIALLNPGSTVAAALGNVAVGDAIELPGTAVSSVNFGSNSLTFVTSAGTTSFTDVSYLAGAVPSGFTATADPTTGLERIAFGQQATSFQQSAASVVDGVSEFIWSNGSNWTDGVPFNASAVTFSAASAAGGYDNIASLSLDSLNLEEGSLAVAGALTIGSLGLAGVIEADTLLNGGTATLTIDALTGSGHAIVAAGSNAIVTVRAASDPGDVYDAVDGGMVVLSPTPTANSNFNFGTSTSNAGTLALLNPGSMIAAHLNFVTGGDAIELPGATVASVEFVGSVLTVVTNLGTTTFSNVGYLAGLPSGYLAAPDATTGLQEITFTSAQATAFQQVGTSVVDGYAQYEWSNASNWSPAPPTDGNLVTFGGFTQGNALGYDNAGYDDIASLLLGQLTIEEGYLAVAGTLIVNSLSFAANPSEGIEADTLLSGDTAAVTIDALTGSSGTIEAIGTGAVTTLQASNDPGETYQAGDGGMVVLSATPTLSSVLALNFGDGTADIGTIALLNPGTIVHALLKGVAVGDAIELPGSFVSTVTYGEDTLTVVASAGTTTFSDVSYLPVGTQPNAFVAAPDAATGLEKITFGTLQSTDFLQTASSMVGGEPEYLWSTGTNWTNGVPLNGESVGFNVSGGYDDIANLALNDLNLQQGTLAVAGTLSVDDVNISDASVIEADTLLRGGTAVLTIDGLAGPGGYVEAVGSTALTDVQATSDPGKVYAVADGGMLLLSATPDPNSPLLFNFNGGTFETGPNSGTFALLNPGSTISAMVQDVAIGNSLELPGSSVASVAYGTDSLTVVTNLGTTTFSNVDYAANKPAGFTATHDATTGLENIAFTLCFCRGTLIRTPTGDVPVEHLTVGDLVVTARGAHRPITWIGVGRVVATRGRRNAATPVIVHKGAFAENVPYADLRVTKGHSFHFDGALIPVEFLVNHRSVTWDDRAQEVALYHIELATHDILLANGAPAESYRDDGNRWLFQNTNRNWTVPPAVPAASVLTGGPLVDRVWRQLLERAGPRPGLPLTADPDLHLMLDGERLEASEQRDGRYSFLLRRRPSTVRICSRASAPQELGLSRDPRMLGVAVRQIVLAPGAAWHVVEADDVRLSEGFHAFEADNGIRWTNGAAALSPELLAVMAGAGMLVVVLGGATRYADEGELALVA